LNEVQLENLLPRTLTSNAESDDCSDDDGNDSAPAKPMSYSEVATTGTALETDESKSKRRKLEEEVRKAETTLQHDMERVGRLVDALQSEFPPMRSCYDTYADLDPSYRTEQWAGEPIYTNYSLWKGTLDYIFYSPAGLSTREVLSLPVEEQLKPGIPNDTFASDHVALVARFDLA
ncbi:RNA exonuclease ngl2, partial [Coemansia sp. RSA 2610]